MQPLIINVALTGMVTSKDHNPATPVTPGEIVEDAVRCAKAGASIVHIHARDEDANPTPDPEVYKRILDCIRARVPELILCVTTSGRNWPEFEHRAAVLDVKPDMASLTLGSLNFPTGPSVNSPDMIQKLYQAMVDRGIKPELEVFEAGMIDWAEEWLFVKGDEQHKAYWNMLFGNRGTASLSLQNMGHMVALPDNDSIVSFAGIGQFQLRANVAGICFADGIRTGLEDNVWYEKGTLANNALLVERIVLMASEMGREISTCKQTRERLGLER